LSYTSSCMTTAIMIGFLNGVRGKTGFFFRTPKQGLATDGNNQYHRDVRLDRIAIGEGILATMALAMSITVLLDGVWALALTVAGQPCGSCAQLGDCGCGGRCFLLTWLSCFGILR